MKTIRQIISESSKADVAEILRLIQNDSELTEKVRPFLTDRKNIHHGCEGYVVECGDEIVKIYYDGKLPEEVSSLIISSLVKSKFKRFKVLPTITDYGLMNPAFIIRGNYTPYTRKCYRLIAALFGDENSNVYGYEEGCLFDRVYYGNDRSNLTSDEKFACKWLDDAVSELEMIGQDEIGDLTIHNIAEDDKGNIRYIDFTP